MNTIEKLNLWDRFFNRYKMIIKSEGVESWCHHSYGVKIPYSDYSRKYVVYRKIDRLTGSEELIKKYFN